MYIHIYIYIYTPCFSHGFLKLEKTEISQSAISHYRLSLRRSKVWSRSRSRMTARTQILFLPTGLPTTLPEDGWTRGRGEEVSNRSRSIFSPHKEIHPGTCSSATWERRISPSCRTEPPPAESSPRHTTPCSEPRPQEPMTSQLDGEAHKRARVLGASLARAAAPEGRGGWCVFFAALSSSAHLVATQWGPAVSNFLPPTAGRWFSAVSCHLFQLCVLIIAFALMVFFRKRKTPGLLFYNQAASSLRTDFSSGKREGRWLVRGSLVQGQQCVQVAGGRGGYPATKAGRRVVQLGGWDILTPSAQSKPRHGLPWCMLTTCSFITHWFMYSDVY